MAVNYILSGYVVEPQILLLFLVVLARKLNLIAAAAGGARGKVGLWVYVNRSKH